MICCEDSIKAACGRPRGSYLPLLGLLLCLWAVTAAGCAGKRDLRPTLLHTGTPQIIEERVTLLPVMDARVFEEPGRVPNLEEETAIRIPLEQIMALGRDVWRREGWSRNLESYPGSLPESPEFTWRDFPLRDLKTDLALGLTVRRLVLRRTGHNALLGPHAVMDALVLPFFALGALAGNANVDLAARVIPSTRVTYGIEAELNVLSVKGGGLLLAKTYTVTTTDPGVSESRLYEGLLRSPRDGQALGGQRGPDLIEDLFAGISRDPELARLPDLAATALAARSLNHPRVPVEQKSRLAEWLSVHARVPELLLGLLDGQPDGPSGAKPAEGDPAELVLSVGGEADSALRMDSYVVSPDWLEKARARARRFEVAYRGVLGAAGRLALIKQTRPLTSAEAGLEGRLRRILSAWGGHGTGNARLRRTILDPAAPGEEKRAALAVLKENPEYRDNAAFIKARTEEWLKSLAKGERDRVVAISLLAAAKGRDLLKMIDTTTAPVLKSLSGDDRWAGKMVLSRLERGDFHADVLRLAGAMKLPETLPLLLRALREVSTQIRPAPTPSEPWVPMYRRDGEISTRPIPADPVLIIRALGCFDNRPEVIEALRAVFDRWDGTGDIRDETAAEAARSLGRLRAKAAVRAMQPLWRRLAVENRAPLVRRGILDAMKNNPDTVDRAGFLETVAWLCQSPEARGAPIREAMDPIGGLRLAGAVEMLETLVRHPATSMPLRRTAFQALGRMAVPEAESALRRLARAAGGNWADSAAAALEELVRERAVWRALSAS